MSGGLVIIGGGGAGISAATRARRVNPDIPITIYSQERRFSLSVPAQYDYTTDDRNSDGEMHLAREWRDLPDNIRVVSDSRVVRIMPEEKKLLVENRKRKAARSVRYDRLIICTGANPLRPLLPGAGLDGIFTMRSIRDSLAIKLYFDRYNPTQALIVGGSFVGLEMLENLREYPHVITLAERAPQLMGEALDADMAVLIEDYLRSRGINVITNCEAVGFQGEQRVSRMLGNSRDIDCDFVLMATGVYPNSQLAKDAGIELGCDNAIHINNRMETNIPNIFAAGDCVTTFHTVSGHHDYMPRPSTALKQGRVAGENAAGGDAAFKGAIGTAILEVFDLEISRTGLCEKECAALGIPCVTHKIKAPTRPTYFDTVGEINIKLIAEQNSLRLLGAQIVGNEGAGRRIDMLATAITLHATMDQLIDIDAAHAPAFSPVWDPLLEGMSRF
ncbi:MAG: FAD-dependent oxidoreductase [Syntrophomonadaceae bacterium]|nr:FAD-dependent oxidoreductase [Syntrophomonadaceae bacterium]